MEVQLIAAGKVVLLVIAALLPIVNPLSSAPIFLAMTTRSST
jgi:small neutral amino acid transporter SnatA (MarC family)